MNKLSTCYIPGFVTRLCETQAEMSQDFLGIRNQVEEISKKKEKKMCNFFF